MKYKINKSFEYELAYMLTAKAQRMARILAYYELYKISLKVPGDIVECGVFRGVSLMRFISFKQLFENRKHRKIIGFDTFGDFPTTNFKNDQKELHAFIKETGGGQSISKEELSYYIKEKGFKDFELIKGDIIKTVPAYIARNSKLKIAMLNIDTDIYEPAKTIIENLAPKVVKGGVIIFDDYGVFPGETKIADEYSKRTGFKIKKFNFSPVPAYIIKE